MMPRIRLLVVDDHALFREGVVRLLAREPDLEVVGHCSTLAEARAIVGASSPDVILLDYDLGSEIGLTLLSSVALLPSPPRILVVTGGIEAATVVRAVRAEVAGLILKHSDPYYLLQAIRRVANGANWWDPALPSATIVEPEQDAAAAPVLTDRQKKVVSLIVDGLSNKQIADRLQTSEAAIKASIQEAFQKTGVRTRSQLVRLAIEKHSADWLTE